MESAMMVLPLNYASPNVAHFLFDLCIISFVLIESYSKGHKRIKLLSDANTYGCTSASVKNETEEKKPKVSQNIVDYSDPFAISNLLDNLDSGKFGSVTKDIKDLIDRKVRTWGTLCAKNPLLSNIFVNAENPSKQATKLANQNPIRNIIDLEDDTAAVAHPLVVVLSDDEDEEDKRPYNPFREVVLTQPPAGHFLTKDIMVRGYVENIIKVGGDTQKINQMKEESLVGEIAINKDPGVYVGVEEDDDDKTKAEDDGLGDIWQEMSMALECSKDVVEDNSANEHMEKDGEDCDHSFILKDDLGYVCRICGVIDRGIESIIEVQFNKVKRSTRTYMYDSWNGKGRDASNIDGVKLSENDLMVTDIYAHPRHMKQMKPHQVEGFNFLRSNLVTDNPGGCILAHAPGSGKTFMIISFMQSFLAKYPQARPLVVLPKGILTTWKKEFQTWQIEDVPLLDFYTVKADSRAQQLEVLKKWVEQKSILFLGYKQFSAIVCDSENSKTAATCQEILLKQPSILILDEGHTPRNENTDVLQSLAKVQTPRKVVLSGTLYQNHVKEVFNILNLVRPKFLKLDTSRVVVKRIMSRVHIPGLRKQFKAGAHAAFYELVEHCLLKDDDFKRKVTVIQDLREMTSKVLHYYKGDFLDELPGLVDFTVVLNLSSKQKSEVSKLKMLGGKGGKFKLSAVGSSVLLHPKLKSLPENSVPADDKMDEVLEKLDVKDGVKAKFFLSLLNLCDSAGERLLVFGQYLQPLKFLERLVVKIKGWSLGREVFVISGESTAEQREWSMERFNNSPHSKVFFGSIKACGEGISLVGASRIIILDVHLNPSVTRQAIGRAFRPGQTKKVYAYRLVCADTHEEKDHATCFKKELISRMWFEWNEYCGYRNFEMETVDVSDCGDLFLETPLLREDVRDLYRSVFMGQDYLSSMMEYTSTIRQTNRTSTDLCVYSYVIEGWLSLFRNEAATDGFSASFRVRTGSGTVAIFMFIVAVSDCLFFYKSYSKGHKRMKTSGDAKDSSLTASPSTTEDEAKEETTKISQNVNSYSGQFAFAGLKNLDSGCFGSVTKDIKGLMELKAQVWGQLFRNNPLLSQMFENAEKNLSKPASKLKIQQARPNVIDLEDECAAVADVPLVVILSNDEDEGERRPSNPLSEVVLMQPSDGQYHTENTEVRGYAERTIQVEERVSLAVESDIENYEDVHVEENKVRGYAERTIQVEEKVSLDGKSDAEKEKDVGVEENKVSAYAEETMQIEDKVSVDGEIVVQKDRGVYVGVEEDDDNQTEIEGDDLGEIWQEMYMSLELSKDAVEDNSGKGHNSEDGEDCDHSFILKDDLGYVCRICGIIERAIDTIIEVQFSKVKRSSRTYVYDSRNAKGRDSSSTAGVKLSEDAFLETGIAIHPRHMKQMKLHQVEGFNFLCNNLLTDNPGGCIMAHAPGSGKTFMIISFIQSFLGKYPQARPLVVLPKGILSTWKKEFKTWQIEDFPLFDFYTVKADSRAQQLEVLKKWVEQKSILFLGYKQFSTIVCDSETSKTAATCREILLKQPSILILDEGHTPRNDNTDVLQSLARVQTPRKVVLSGTLYQNHVKEVFNILNLVRPKFLRLDTSRAVVNRIMSRIPARKPSKAGADTAFCESVEHSLLKEDDFKRKVSVIQDLREMTSKVLHYYKGDVLDELPGLVDFTVVLNLSSRQKSELPKLNTLGREGKTFKMSAVGSSVFLHPELNSLPENSVPTDDKMDEILVKLDLGEGVKAKFFFNMLNLCESAGEKLLVFGQYLQPLKFLERLVVKIKGWSPGREIFVISGDSSAEDREYSMERFNSSPHSRVFFGSIKACGEGISLVGASRIIILDTHLNPSVTRQAIGRAFRPGQKKKVYAYRLVSADTHEEKDHTTCFKKELISRMWFEWNEFCGYRNFELETVDVNNCDDPFLESPLLREDIRILYRR
ncbi:hypothetical protein Pint_34760 [Pistacia integerrima]|uniref:Uncharacterized protein n=1 Tax=Pistacia integerrima TaxID=434235 RepID=A0ACC0X3S4_9ROSI|nr:hypothetical protein Pint_34760 [Pistacia integerrima]